MNEVTTTMKLIGQYWETGLGNAGISLEGSNQQSLVTTLDVCDT